MVHHLPSVLVRSRSRRWRQSDGSWTELRCGQLALLSMLSTLAH